MRPGGGPADSPGWTVRVVPNLYPALTPENPASKQDPRPDLFAAMPANGAHEVIVNAPQSVYSLAELPVEQVIAAVEVWRERMRAHTDCACVQLIVNERREAGASLPHTHAQLYALDFVPADVARERERAGAYATRTMGSELLGDLVAEEVRRSERVVAIDEEAVLMAPYASRVPYHLMLAPRRPRARFELEGPSGRGVAARRAAPSRAPPGDESAAEPVGAHRAARRGSLLLADRRVPPPDSPRGPRALHGGQPQHRLARGRGRAPARCVRSVFFLLTFETDMRGRVRTRA